MLPVAPVVTDDVVSRRVRAAVEGSAYAGYTYSYPHKLAYRALMPGVPLEQAWADEAKDALFLYAHVPFCEQRCGFCNLFTVARADETVVAAYLDAFARQARVVRAALGPTRFASAAIGGGTPTFLGRTGLERLFGILEDTFDVDLGAIPCSLEVSPQTATDETLAPVAERRLARVSMGVQSFFADETLSLHRRQERSEVERAVAAIRRAGARILNLDLMYGLAGQTEAGLLRSIEAALQLGPEELYLYPLYVRPLTVLGKRDAAPEDWDERRLRSYRAARDHLLGAGYEQVSMRMFRLPSSVRPRAGRVYRCQSDGMVGLGCGARSYTDTLHYSSPFATGPLGVRTILAEWIASDDRAFSEARWGIRLDEDERRRRYVVLELLSDEGLDLEGYRSRFGGDAPKQVPELGSLLAWPGEALVVRTDSRIVLTDRGRERSDALGPLFASEAVRRRVHDAECD